MGILETLYCQGRRPAWSCGGHWKIQLTILVRLGLGKPCVDNAPSVGFLRCSKNPVDARECFFQQRAKYLNLAGALTYERGREQKTSSRRKNDKPVVKNNRSSEPGHLNRPSMLTALGVGQTEAPARLRDFTLCWKKHSLASTGFLEHLKTPTDGTLSTFSYSKADFD